MWNILILVSPHFVLGWGVTEHLGGNVALRQWEHTTKIKLFLGPKKFGLRHVVQSSNWRFSFQGIENLPLPMTNLFHFQSFPVWNFSSLFLKKCSSVPVNKKNVPQFHRIVYSFIITLMTTSNTHLCRVGWKTSFTSLSQSLKKRSFLFCI